MNLPTVPARTDSGLVLVPHFHWDREWYEPFQVFRHRLVDAVDRILDLVDAEPEFRFTMDGQTAAALDYLEMRPQNRDRFVAAVRRGQLAIGPWLILLDEFLCSGETIVRNLQLGIRDAERLGGSMAVGYLPDMFGHIAQMPQLLRAAGIEHTAFWRGVPGRVAGHAFRWEAPDGSAVRAEYLFDGYGNGLDLLLVPKAVPVAVENYRRLTSARWGADPILGMAGTDHVPPRADLMELVRRFSSDGAPIRVATIAEYVTEHVVEEPGVTVTGELRSHARGNILPGVLSIRWALKRAMSRAERTALEAERAGLWSSADAGPFLELAWRKIVESSAHDSVVGSGTDETVGQVQSRLEEAEQLARAVRDAALADLASAVPSDAWLVWNPSTAGRRLLVEAQAVRAEHEPPLAAADADGRPLPLQPLAAAATVLADETMDSADVTRVLRRIHRRELFGLQIERVDLQPGRLTFELAAVPSTETFDLLQLSVDLAELTAAHPGPWRVVTVAERRETVLVEVPVAASGLAAVRLGVGGPVVEPESPVRVAPRRMRNDETSVEVADDGTLVIIGADGTTLTGVGRVVDGGDRGDSYNYGPPADDELIDRPERVGVTVLEDGPLRGVLSVVREYRWPERLGATPDVRSEVQVPTTVTMRVELRAGDPVVHVDVDFENRSADHRVRLHVPLPETVSTTQAEGQFFVATRGSEGEGGWGEYPLPTYPADGFVAAGPVTVLLERATEYELVDDGRALAITMLRAVGSMSVNLHPLRDEPAGSEIPVPGAQEPGARFGARYGILVGHRQPGGVDAVQRADWFRFSGRVVRGTASPGFPLPPDRSGVDVQAEQVAVTSLRRVPNGLELRLANLSSEQRPVKLAGPFDIAEPRDLLGRPLVSGASKNADLAPWSIRTLLLR